MAFSDWGLNECIQAICARPAMYLGPGRPAFDEVITFINGVCFGLCMHHPRAVDLAPFVKFVQGRHRMGSPEIPSLTQVIEAAYPGRGNSALLKAFATEFQNYTDYKIGKKDGE